MAAPTAFTAVVEPVVNNVLLTVTPAASTDALYVYRVGPSGSHAGVRGAYPLAVSGTTAVVVRDFEAPIGVPITYYAYADDETTTLATVTITIADTGCDDTWLTDLARPTNTQRVIVESLPALNHDVPVTVHSIIGRRSPIVSSDIARTPTFELGLVTVDEDERERTRAILGNGIPVLLRTPPENGIGNLYFSVLGFTEQRIVNRAVENDRLFKANCQQIDRPDPALYSPFGPATYAYVKATFATYTALMAARASYDALLYDYGGGETGDVVPWPPVDV